MARRTWPTVALLAAIAVLLGLLVLVQHAPSAQAQVSEGRTGDVIAVAAPIQDESLLYLIDTNREVILVYSFHFPGSALRRRGVRTGAFEFVAGRLYRWDAMLVSRREYSLKGIGELEGLRPQGGPGSSEFEYKRVQP
ncbi:MAG: hypothetical protein ACOC8D_02505 [bacterium]